MNCAASNEQNFGQAASSTSPTAPRSCRHQEQASELYDHTTPEGAVGSPPPKEVPSARASVTLRVPPFYVLHGPAKLWRSGKLN